MSERPPHQAHVRPSHPPVPIREAATHVVRVLSEAGHEAYFAGGCVRDRLLEIEPTDYDVATSARPEEISRLFRRTQSVGEAFGVILVRHGGHVFEVATFRSDGVYTDGRRPDSVTFTDARRDAMRRDFTINGLFEDPLEDRIIDFVDGQADLRAKVIRAIGSPVERLSEDHLRMLRSVRFAARFGFSIDQDTAEAVRRHAGELVGVSRERIGAEIKKMFCHAHRGVAAWELQYLGLDAAVLGEEAWQGAPTRVGRLSDQADYPTALAAWLLDRHAGSDADRGAIALRWADRLMLSNAERSALWSCLEVHHVLVTDWARLGVAQQKRLAASEIFTKALSILQTIDREAFVTIRRRVLELSETGLAPVPLIDGADLIAIGLTPGPLFRGVLDAVYDAQLEGSISTAEEGLSLARAVAAENQADQGPGHA